MESPPQSRVADARAGWVEAQQALASAERRLVIEVLAEMGDRLAPRGVRYAEIHCPASEFQLVRVYDEDEVEVELGIVDTAATATVLATLTSAMVHGVAAQSLLRLGDLRFSTSTRMVDLSKAALLRDNPQEWVDAWVRSQ